MAELKAQVRTVTGKKVKPLRAKGLLPAVVYGGKDGATALTVSGGEFMRAWRTAGESTFIDLAIEGNGSKHVLIHDVTLHPVRNVPIHVDFYEARADKPIRVYVPVAFEGESEAVKSLGGSLFKGVHEIEVEALPKDLPHNLSVDISRLQTFDDHILAKDIVLPKGVLIHAEADLVIASIVPPRSDEELATLSETSEVNLDTIEVAKKGKKEDAEETPEESA